MWCKRQVLNNKRFLQIISGSTEVVMKFSRLGWHLVTLFAYEQWQASLSLHDKVVIPHYLFVLSFFSTTTCVTIFIPFGTPNKCVLNVYSQKSFHTLNRLSTHQRICMSKYPKFSTPVQTNSIQPTYWTESIWTGPSLFKFVFLYFFEWQFINIFMFFLARYDSKLYHQKCMIFTFTF